MEIGELIQSGDTLNIGRISLNNIYSGITVNWSSSTGTYSMIKNSHDQVLGNSATGFSSIAAGMNNTASANHAMALWGTGNTASSLFSTVIGGQQNLASSSISTFIGNGSGNTATHNYSTIVNGQNNRNFGKFSTILNGVNNLTEGDFYTFNAYSTVINGVNNSAMTAFSTVLGGSTNLAGGPYPLSDTYSSVLNGTSNSAISFYSTVIGGSNNLASNTYSTVLNGSNNWASGSSSVAMGSYATAKSDYDFSIGNGSHNTITLSGSVGTVACLLGVAVGYADYAEFFEFFDKNPNNEDRRGFFVSLDNNGKITLGNSNTIGIISSTVAILGDSADFVWDKMYLKDIWGCTATDKDGNKILNPDYNPDIEYIPRRNRSSYAPVGLLGKIHVRTSEKITSNFVDADENGFAKNGTKYPVLETIREWTPEEFGVVRILFK